MGVLREPTAPRRRPEPEQQLHNRVMWKAVTEATFPNVAPTLDPSSSAAVSVRLITDRKREGETPVGQHPVTIRPKRRRGAVAGDWMRMARAQS